MSAFALDHNRSLTQYVHRIWQLPQGLPDATVTSIIQSNDGYLWLGTETGLVRFDGVRFVRLEDIAQTPLKRAWIRNVIEGPQHELWVGTNDAGLYRLENGTATPFLQNEEAAHAAVQCLVEDTHGNVWACTSNGLVRENQGKVTVYGTAQGLPTNNIHAATVDAEGTLWVGGDGNQLAQWTGSSFRVEPLESLPAYGSIRALLSAGDGTLWIGTTSGLIHLENGKEHLLTVKNGLADNWIHCLMQDRDGDLWAGTNNGISRLRNNRFESYDTEDGLSQSTVYSLYEDREGSLWVGTKHGLNQFLDGRTIPYTVSEGLPTNNVGPVLEDRKGTIWVGTLGSGLCRFEDGRFSVLTTKQGLTGNLVYALAEDQDGSLWVGTNNGLDEVRDSRIYRTYTKADGLPENRIQSLYRDHSGVLWIVTPSGVAMFSNGSLSRPKESVKPSQAQLLGGGEDKDGNFLEATESGLKIYRNDELHDFDPTETALREVDTFYTDDDGLLWMGTLGSGLRLLKDGKVYSYFMRDGLFDNEIYGIVGDAQDRLWMASSKGIFSVYRSDLRKFADGKIQKVISTPYSPLDGLRTIECKSGVQPAVWKAQDGRLWFSTIRGLLVIDPARLEHYAPAPPPVVVENVTVNGQDKVPEQINDLAPGRKDLEFRYTALSYLAPGSMTFRYILDGYDSSWTDAGNRRVAYYTNLPPGQFRFHVVACNLDGVCNESSNPVGFSLASQYYQRSWFPALCAFFLGLVIWLGWRRRVQSLKQQFEIVLTERGRIARELHDTLIQGFSGITMGMQAVSSGLPDGEERSQLSELIHDAAHCLRQARQSIAGLRGDRHPDAELHIAIANAAKEIAKTSDVELKLNLQTSPANVPSEVNYNLLRIAQEAITNSVQHAEARTIEVALTFPEEAIQLSVQDDGKGLAVADQANRSGHYGLTGMKERASQIGADFDLSSKPSHGTTVRVFWKSAKTKPAAI